MASSRVVSRLLVPTTLSRLSTVGSVGSPVRHFIYRNPKNLPDIFLGSSSNVFRDLEKEFDRMQRQFDHFFRGGNNTNDNRSLVNYSRDGTNGNYFIV